MRQTQWFIHLYGLNGQRHGDEHPHIYPFGAWHYLPLPYQTFGSDLGVGQKKIISTVGVQRM